MLIHLARYCQQSRDAYDGAVFGVPANTGWRRLHVWRNMALFGARTKLRFHVEIINAVLLTVSRIMSDKVGAGYLVSGGVPALRGGALAAVCCRVRVVVVVFCHVCDRLVVVWFWWVLWSWAVGGAVCGWMWTCCRVVSLCDCVDYSVKLF